MKKTLLLLLLVFNFHYQIFSQSFSWLETVDLSYEFNPGMVHYTTCANPEGGAYFFGIEEHISFYNESMGSLFLKKYSTDGDLTWSRTIQGESAVSGAQCDSEGDVYIYGQMLTDANFWGEDSLEKIGIGTDAFLARVSADGDLLWCQNLSTLPEGEGTISQVIPDPDGNLAVAYWTWLNSYILFFSTDGTYLSMIVQENVNLVSSIDFDDAGNLYAAGSCAGVNGKFAGVSYPAPFSYTTYIVKYNSSGQPSWVKFTEDVTCNFPMVKVDGAGGIYFAGQLMIPTLFDTISTDGPAWVYDFFLSRLNPEGEYQWVEECPEVMTGDATVGSPHFLDVDAEGNALLSGITRGVIDWGDGIITDVTANYQDIIIWSYSPDGQLNWVNTVGGDGFEGANCISAGSDGSAYLAGVISGSGAFDTIMYETDGILHPFLAKMTTGIETGLDRPYYSNIVRIYPNPASDRVFIESGKMIKQYSIKNITGQELISEKLQLMDELIEIQFDLESGIYILSLEAQENTWSNFPIIVKR